MNGIKWEKRGYMVAAPSKGHKHAGWAPFTTVWGGKQNAPIRKSS